VRIDRDRISELEARDPAPIAVRQAGSRSVRRVDMQPQALATGEFGE
jgi:hypothetical protein